MKEPMSWAAVAEGALGLASFVLGVLTLMWRDWIELVFRIDPDHRSGALEWLVAGGLLAAAVASGALAQRSWRRSAPA